MAATDNLLPPLDLGIGNYDLNANFAVPPGTAKNFPVGPAELIVMAVVGGLALFVATLPTNRR